MKADGFTTLMLAITSVILFSTAFTLVRVVSTSCVVSALACEYLAIHAGAFGLVLCALAVGSGVRTIKERRK